MSEQDTNHQAAAPPPAPAADPGEPTGFDRALAIVAIVIGLGVVILGLDMATGGRVLGFTESE